MENGWIYENCVIFVILVNFITTEPCSPSLEMLFLFLYREIMPFYGPTIQVSELLYVIYPDF